MQIDRAPPGIWLVDEDARAGHEQVLIDCRKLAARVESGKPMIDTGAEHDVIVVSEQFVGVGKLRRSAEGVAGRLVAIEFAQEGVAQRIRSCRASNGTGNRIAAARPIDAEIGIAIARPYVRAVAIDMRLLEAAEIDVALKRPGIRESMAQRRVDESELKMRGLRPSINGG